MRATGILGAGLALSMAMGVAVAASPDSAGQSTAQPAAPDETAAAAVAKVSQENAPGLPAGPIQASLLVVLSALLGIGFWHAHQPARAPVPAAQRRLKNLTR